MSSDSIFKGHPRTASIEFVAGFDPGKESNQYLEIILFSRVCIIGENCPGRDQPGIPPHQQDTR